MSAYNIKMIKYPNGSAQLRRYSKPLKAKEYKHECEKFTYQEEQKLRKGGSVWKDNVEYVLSPFDGCIVPRVKVFKDKPEKNPDSDIYHSLCRTKNKIYSYGRCVKWEMFVTFTFSSEKTDRYDYDECSRLVRRWLNNQRRNAPDLQYLIVPEQHKDGAWHFHGLLSNTGNIKFIDSGKKDKKGNNIYNMAKWSNGFTTATAVTDVFKVSKYIGKYITKDLCELTKGKQRYFVSQNMPEPEEFTFFVDTDVEDFSQFLGTLADSIGYEVTFVSSPRNKGSFVDVDYYELQDRIIINDSKKSI